MKYPNFLKENDIIGITAPSAGTDNELDFKKIDMATKKMNEIGFSIKETVNCRTDELGRSSSKEERAKQFEELMMNDEVKAIIGLSGGEFLLEMLPYVNQNTIQDNSKWIQGYSDMTGLLFQITTNLDIATIYSYNYRTFAMRNWHSSLKNNIEILKGNIVKQSSFDKFEDQRTEKTNGDEPFYTDSEVKWINLNGEECINLNGRIIGGCLDLIMCLIGTKFDNTKVFINKYKNDGIIWYFDNCELSSEALVRAMWQLKEAGYFEHCKGIVFGRSGTNRSYYDIDFKEAVRISLKDLNVPIIVDADIGHKPPMMTIINGAIANIKSKNGKGSIELELR